LPVPPAHEANGKKDPYEGARPSDQEEHRRMICRVRTIADMISTGMIESPAENIDDIISEVAAARVTERGTRADDKASEAAMEDRKKAGYF
jgi:sulfate adenylyltransferase subunit 2